MSNFKQFYGGVSGFLDVEKFSIKIFEGDQNFR